MTVMTVYKKSSGSTAHTAAGAALISALVLVGIVTLLLAKLLSQQSYLVRQTQAQHTLFQSGLLLDGGIDWARLILRSDNNGVDHLEENWSVPIRRVPVESGESSGWLSGQLVDAQSKFNVNNLLRPLNLNASQNTNTNASTAAATKKIELIDTQQLAILTRLLRELKLPETWAEQIATRLKQTRALDATQSSQDLSDADLNQVSLPLTHPDELIALLKPDETQQQLIEDYLIVLPVGSIFSDGQNISKINANTADAVLMGAALNNNTIAKQLVASRKSGYLNSESDLVARLNSYQYKTSDNPDFDAARFGVQTRFFLLQGELEGKMSLVERTRWISIEALLYRNNGQANVIWKRLGSD
jgi:general secretion pathway protein K